MQKKSMERMHHLDLLRAIACLSVVMIHVSAEFVVRGSSGPDFWLGVLMDSLARAGVPLFVMISGALMLDEGYEFTKKKWLIHIGRMAAFYVFWRIACGLVGSPTYHLWFVPMIVMMYLLVPLLRLWVKAENIRSVEWFLAIAAVVLFAVPQITEILIRETGGSAFLRGFLDDLNVAYAVRYVVYFVLGWYLNRGVRRRKLACGLSILGVCMTFAGTCWATLLLGMDTYPFFRNFTVNVLLHSAGLFTLCRARFAQPENPAGWAHRIVRRIGECSLGVYAVHLYVISRLMPVLGRLHTAVALPLVFLLSLVLSAVISMILRKIPVLKQIV